MKIISEPKSKSQSEQPATCPICSATIRQSRNLRRHLELRHFKKRTPKKIKKEMANGKLICSLAFDVVITTRHWFIDCFCLAEQLGNTSTEILSDNGNGNNTITVTMEPGSDQQTITVNGQQTGQQHVLTTNSDGSLSISGLPGHIIGSLGNVSWWKKSWRTIRKLKFLVILGNNYPNWRWTTNWIWTIDNNARAVAKDIKRWGLSRWHDRLSHRRASWPVAFKLSQKGIKMNKMQQIWLSLNKI